jgi:acyl-CoA reductase-like NAD-dependent aldehyde dehydrogenase
MDTQLLIGGKEAPASGGMTFDRLNPLSGECATRAAAASVEDATLAADAAATAFPEWAELGPSARRTLLNKAADAIQSRGEEFT